jgi:hypothetical protein
MCSKFLKNLNFFIKVGYFTQQKKNNDNNNNAKNTTALRFSARSTHQN